MKWTSGQKPPSKPSLNEEELNDYYENKAPKEFWALLWAAVVTFVPFILLVVAVMLGVFWLCFSWIR